MYWLRFVTSEPGNEKRVSLAHRPENRKTRALKISAQNCCLAPLHFRPLCCHSFARLVMKLPSNFLRVRVPSLTNWDRISTPTLSRHALAKELFQRVPPLAQATMLVIAIWGPRNTPLLFSVLIIFFHATFVASNARTAYGMWFVLHPHSDTELISRVLGSDARRCSNALERIGARWPARLQSLIRSNISSSFHTIKSHSILSAKLFPSSLPTLMPSPRIVFVLGAKNPSRARRTRQGV